MPRPVPIACVVIVCGVLSVQGYRRGLVGRPEPTPDTPPGAPCSREQRATLGGLSEGQMLAGFRVEQLACRSADKIEIEVRRGAAQAFLSLEQPGASPHEPPRKVAGRSLFYNLHQHQIPAAEIDALLDALVKQIAPAAPPP